MLHRLNEYKIIVEGFNQNKTIPLDQLFKPRDEDLFWVYVAAILLLIFLIIGCFLLLLYMNYRAEERSEALVSTMDKDLEKLKPANTAASDIINTDVEVSKPAVKSQ